MMAFGFGNSQFRIYTSILANIASVDTSNGTAPDLNLARVT
jgi:hypothetical protein